MVRGGRLVGASIYASANQGDASLCAPGVVRIGCEEHPIPDWLADDPPCDRIPWGEYVTEDERKAIRAVIRGMAMQEALGKTWEKEEE